MPIAMIVLVVGLGLGALMAGASMWRHGQAEPLDPTREKRWLVTNVAGRPRLAGFVRRRLDRTRAGGLLLTVGFAGVLILAIFVGAVFDMVDETSGFAQFDQSVARLGAEIASPASTRVLVRITHLGGTPGVIIAGGAAAAYGLWRHRSWHVVLFMIAVVAGQAIANSSIKWIVMRERPAIDQLVPFSGSSFPSGHSSAAAATYAAIALIVGLGRPLRTRAILAGLAGLMAGMVAASRALLGVHWLTDIIAGLAVGWAWFIVCAVAFGGRFMQLGEPRDEVAARGLPDAQSRGEM